MQQFSVWMLLKDFCCCCLVCFTCDIPAPLLRRELDPMALSQINTPLRGSHFCVYVWASVLPYLPRICTMQPGLVHVHSKNSLLSPAFLCKCNKWYINRFLELEVTDEAGQVNQASWCCIAWLLGHFLCCLLWGWVVLSTAHSRDLDVPDLGRDCSWQGSGSTIFETQTKHMKDLFGVIHGWFCLALILCHSLRFVQISHSHPNPGGTQNPCQEN